MKNWFPLPETYQPRKDIAAGITLGVILIPQAMAYGLLAGVAPVYGMYSALFPLLIYTLLASTPHVSVGPTALASLLCLGGLSGMAGPGSETYLAYAILLGGLTGLIQFLFGVLRFGGLVSLLSRPVLSGFVSAAAVLIIASQAGSILGLDMARTDFFHERVLEFLSSLATFHWPTALLGLGSLALLYLGKYYLPRWPVMLLLIVLSTLAVFLFRLDLEGIDVVGGIPAGLPAFRLVEIDMDVVLQLLPVATVLALISFIETLSIGNAFATRHDYYRVIPNRELIALGLSKLGGSLFQAIPTSASFSRSAVVEEGGGRGPVSGLAACLLLVVVLLFLTPAFYYLPITVLSAVIIYSVGKLFDLEEMKRLWKLAPRELAVLLVTFVFTLFAGLQYGIAGGVVLSLIFVYLRAARPHLAELGRIRGTNAFRNIDRFPEQVEIDPEVLAVRFDSELYFGNAEFFQDRILEMAFARGKALRLVIVDAHTINDLDTTGVYALERLHDKLQSHGVPLYLTGVIGPVRDVMFKSGLMDNMGAESFFLSIQDAITHFKQGGGDRDWDLPAVQHG